MSAAIASAIWRRIVPWRCSIDETLLGEAKVANALQEQVLVELAIEAAECRVGGDPLGDLGIGNAEPKLAGAFVERRRGDHLAEQLLLDAERSAPGRA